MWRGALSAAVYAPVLGDRVVDPYQQAAGAELSSAAASVAATHAATESAGELRGGWVGLAGFRGACA